MPVLDDDFVPARGLVDGNAQTLFASLARRRRLALRRERLATPDGDFVDVDVLDGAAGAPTVVVLHGLEGSSASGYVQHVLAGLAARRWRGVALNFRSCSGAPNRQAAAYSSGDFRDLAFVASRLPRPLAAVGFSLGASVLLNALAQRGAALGLSAAVAVSAPFELDACATMLDSGRGFSPVYLRNFLGPMKAKALEKARRFPGLLDARRIGAAATIRAFDAAVTAPLFGYASAEDYYARCSAGPQLAAVATPTLLVTAEDDPIAPARFLPSEAARHPHLSVLRTARGGHVGFVGGSVLRPRYWAEARAVAWLEERLR